MGDCSTIGEAAFFACSFPDGVDVWLPDPFVLGPRFVDVVFLAVEGPGDGVVFELLCLLADDTLSLLFAAAEFVVGLLSAVLSPPPVR